MNEKNISVQIYFHVMTKTGMPVVWSFVIYERPILDDELKPHFAGKKLHSLPTIYVLQLIMLKRQNLCKVVTRPDIVS